MTPGSDDPCALPAELSRAAQPQKPPTPADLLQQARAGLQYVARFLEFPNAAGLENARRCLQVVIGQIQTYQAVTRSQDTSAHRRAKEALQQELLHINIMFREAGGLFGGWKRVLSTRLGGYTRHGRPAPLRCRQHVAMKI
jgi:hypothetical protein